MKNPIGSPIPTTIFGDTTLAVHKGMKDQGRDQGVSIDSLTRVASIPSPLTRDQSLHIDSPQAREKILFAARIAPTVFPNQAGSQLAYEDPVEKTDASTRYIDVSMRSSTDPQKTLSTFEIKIAAGADPWPEIEKAMSQLLEYQRRMHISGRLAPLGSASVIVFSEPCVQDPAWQSAEYFNEQGGPGSMKPNAANLREQCKKQLSRFGMVCLTWLFDMSTPESLRQLSQELSAGSLFSKAPTSFTLPYVGEFIMRGKGHTIGTNDTSVGFLAGPLAIGLSPTANPSGASTLQNTRNYAPGPISKPGEARAEILMERIKGLEARKMSAADIQRVAAGYSGTQTGANMRRIMGLRSESLHCVMPGGPNGTLLFISTNCSLSDGQSSTACFSSMARAAIASSTYEQYEQRLRVELSRYGIDYEQPKELSRKLFENCPLDEARSSRFEAFKTYILAPDFDVKIEFPDTQEEGAQSSQAANQVYPQSLVDFSLARMREAFQRMFSVGKSLGKSLGVAFPFCLPKQRVIERSEDMQITELAQLQYTGEAAAPAIYMLHGAQNKATPRLCQDAEAGASIHGATLRRCLDGGLADEAALTEALTVNHQAQQALSRAGFEGATEAKRLKNSLNFLMPDARRVSELVEPVRAGIHEVMASSGVQAGLDRGWQQIKKQREAIRKEGKRITAAQRVASNAILDFMEAELSLNGLGELPEEMVSRMIELKFNHALNKHAASGDCEELIRCASLLSLARDAAAQIALPQGIDIKPAMLTRMLYASIQLSFEDGGLGALGCDSWTAWHAQLPIRIELARGALAEKLNHISQTVPERLSFDRFKALGKGAMEAAHYHGGTFAPALPPTWAGVERREDGSEQIVYPAHKSGALWLLHLGISADGKWHPEAGKLHLRKPLILISR